jgi:hypothetical protein
MFHFLSCSLPVHFSILSQLTLSRIFPVYISRSYVPFWGCSSHNLPESFGLLHSCLLARLLTYLKFMIGSRIIRHIFSLFAPFLLFLSHSSTYHPSSVLPLFPCPAILLICLSSLFFLFSNYLPVFLSPSCLFSFLNVSLSPCHCSFSHLSHCRITSLS